MKEQAGEMPTGKEDSFNYLFIFYQIESLITRQEAFWNSFSTLKQKWVSNNICGQFIVFFFFIVTFQRIIEFLL